MYDNSKSKDADNERAHIKRITIHRNGRTDDRQNHAPENSITRDDVSASMIQRRETTGSRQNC